MSVTDKLKNLLAAQGISTPQSAANTASLQAQAGNSTFYNNNQAFGITSTGNTGNVTIHTGNAFGGLTATQLGSLLSGYGSPITAEEKAELEELKKEHEFKLKLAKLDIFKKLPSDIRQLVINAHLWQACCTDMNNTIVAKDPKLEELELKNEAGKIFVSSGTNINGYWSSPSIFGNFIATTLPTGITVDDLKQAHMEATLEEQILDGEANS